jgi:hypothetical protein
VVRQLRTLDRDPGSRPTGSAIQELTDGDTVYQTAGS